MNELVPPVGLVGIARTAVKVDLVGVADGGHEPAVFADGAVVDGCVGGSEGGALLEGDGADVFALFSLERGVVVEGGLLGVDVPDANALVVVAEDHARLGGLWRAVICCSGAAGPLAGTRLRKNGNRVVDVVADAEIGLVPS